MAKAKTIKVVSLLPARSIAFHERHANHPDGEALVKTNGDGEAVEVEVGETPAVVDAIHKERIAQVEAKKAPAKKAAAKSEGA